MRAQEKMGHSSMSEGWRDHTSPAQERVNWGDGRGDVGAHELGRREGRDGTRPRDDARGSPRADDPPRTPLGGV